MFVNNCLGYRNHKWFLLFLLFFTCFMFGLFIYCSLAVAYLSLSFNEHRELDSLKIAANVYLIIVIFLHSPIVLLQLHSQISKLCRASDRPNVGPSDENTSHYNDAQTNTVYDGGT
jgi:hypothetical protein